MLGAIAGDIIGSIYENYPSKSKDFPLFDWRCRFTDDTVLTIAVADVILHGGDYGAGLRDYYWRYPDAGYGGLFRRWARSMDPQPYGSFGNGSAMRVSSIGYAFQSLDEVLREAKRSAEATHDHPEGIKGAQAVAAAVFLARKKAGKSEIHAFIEREFGYGLEGKLDLIRPDYRFDVSCQGTVPAAILCFLESTDFEDAVRNAVSLGGDSDTLACITGAIAEAHYGAIPEYIQREVLSRLDEKLRLVAESFVSTFIHRGPPGSFAR